MWCNNRHFVAIGTTVVFAAVVAIQVASTAVGQPRDVVDDSPGSSPELPRPEAIPDREPTLEYKAKRLLAAAQEAYQESLKQFESAKFTDPDVVYRWSLRWMKAEQAAGGESARAAAKGHLQRLEQFVQTLDRSMKEKNLSEAEKKYLFMYTRYYMYEAMAFVEEDERATSHDAAIEVAEDYVTAVLKGNTEAAAKLAAPGSLAASKRLMETFKDFASAESLRIMVVQGSQRETEVHIEEVQPAEKSADGRAKAHFTVALEIKNGRWLVTRLAANKAGSVQKGAAVGAPSWPAVGKTKAGPESPSGAPEMPKVTKVVHLKHAHAQTLRNTMGELLKDKPDLKLGFDEATNTLLVRGTAEDVAEVEELIVVLDAQSSRTSSGEDSRDPDAITAAVPQTAQAYLNAVLQGNIDAAVGLSRPGSEASSRQHIEAFDKLVDRDLVQVVGVKYPEPGKGRALAFTAAVPVTKAQPDGRTKGQLVMTLILEKGGWLVTDCALADKDLDLNIGRPRKNSGSSNQPEQTGERRPGPFE